MSATPPATTVRWFPPAQARWFTARDGTTHHISLAPCGMAGLTLMGLEPSLPGPKTAAGASDSVMDTLITPGITLGGDQWAITVTAGIRTTAGARGEERRSPMFMGYGAIPPTPAQ